MNNKGGIMDIPDRDLRLYGDRIGFMADSITGLGMGVFVWYANTTDTFEDFLKMQIVLLATKGIEVRIGPAIDLTQLLTGKWPPTTTHSPDGKKGFGVYVEESRKVLYRDPVIPRCQPYTGPFKPGP